VTVVKSSSTRTWTYCGFRSSSSALTRTNRRSGVMPASRTRVPGSLSSPRCPMAPFYVLVDPLARRVLSEGVLFGPRRWPRRSRRISTPEVSQPRCRVVESEGCRHEQRNRTFNQLQRLRAARNTGLCGLSGQLRAGVEPDELVMTAEEATSSNSLRPGHDAATQVPAPFRSIGVALLARALSRLLVWLVTCW